MAKRVKVPLLMADGVQVRKLEELREYFDIEKIIGYFLDGRLQTWLEDRYYEDEAEAVAALEKGDAELGKKLSEIFGVEYSDTNAPDTEKIAQKNERLAKLKQLTDDDEIIKNIDSVAFNQEELADLYDNGVKKIYLGEGDFKIPKSKRDLTYIEFAGAKVEGLEEADVPLEPENNLKLELRKRYVFDPKIEKTKTNSDGEIYNRVIHSLFRVGTDEMITDELEDVDSFIISSDNRIVYSVKIDESESNIFVRVNDGSPKHIARCIYPKLRRLNFIYAGDKYIIYEVISTLDSSCYCVYASEYENDKVKVLIGNPNGGSSLKCVYVYDEKLLAIREDLSFLYEISIADVEGTKDNVLQRDVIFAKYCDSNVYTAARKDYGVKFYKINTENGSIEYIADCKSKTISQMEICDNKIVYCCGELAVSGDRPYKLYILDTETHKTILADDDLPSPNAHVEITIKDNVVYYATGNPFGESGYKVKRRINLDGTGKEDLGINDTAAGNKKPLFGQQFESIISEWVKRGTEE